MRDETLIIALTLIIFGAFTSLNFKLCGITRELEQANVKVEYIEHKVDAIEEELKQPEETPKVSINGVVIVNQVSANEPDFILSKDEIDMIATLAMAEAEGESELGQRLVIDTILNRMDSQTFPETVYEVVYQTGQFSSMWNGRYDRCYVKEELKALVEEEIYSRTNNEVAYFTANHYGRYGIPLLQEGHHYFCKEM